MKQLPTLLLVLVLSVSGVASGSEAKCRQIAQREYPNDARMQQFIFDKQIAAFQYMTTTATDRDACAIALREHPEDFSMQKFTYDRLR